MKAFVIVGIGLTPTFARNPIITLGFRRLSDRVCLLDFIRSVVRGMWVVSSSGKASHASSSAQG
jgi:hypothetical protein